MKKYFRLAKKVAAKGDDCRSYRLGAVGVRKDGAIVKSKNIPNRFPEPAAHAEARVCRKLDQGARVYVVRIDRQGYLTIARPCDDCQRVMRRRGVKRCYYSMSENEYGVMIFTH